MKLIRNIFASVAAVFAVASCTIVPEDTFSTAPVAPVMSAHNDILITTATVGEDVTFAWEKARFINTDAYVYDLYVTVGETDALLANDVVNTYYTLSKTDFRTFMKENFELVQNSTHTVKARAEITDAEGQVYASDPIEFKVYVYDDAVPSVLEAEIAEIVLDKDNPSDELALLKWTEPRLVYGEDVTYKVTLKVAEGEEQVLSEGGFDMSYSTTVDALNEAVIAARRCGRAEGFTDHFGADAELCRAHGRDPRHGLLHSKQHHLCQLYPRGRGDHLHWSRRDGAQQARGAAAEKADLLEMSKKDRLFHLNRRSFFDAFLVFRRQLRSLLPPRRRAFRHAPAHHPDGRRSFRRRRGLQSRSGPWNCTAAH